MAVLKSLRVRVLLWVSLTLVLLFAVTIIGLDAIFQRSSEAVLRGFTEYLMTYALGRRIETDHKIRPRIQAIQHKAMDAFGERSSCAVTCDNMF